MFKKDLRLNYNALRENFSEEILLESSLQIANQLLSVPIWQHNYFHLFLSIALKKEVDTSCILTILQGKDKNVIVPKVAGNQLQHFLLTDSTQFIKSKWGVPEPKEGIMVHPNQLDVVFVPLLAFDKLGNRVGYGKGFYDGFLKNCRDDVIKVGLSFFEAEEMIADVEPHDIKLNYCVTPKKIYSFEVG